MGKIAVVLILFLPVIMLAQEINYGSFMLDFGKKKRQTDTTQQQPDTLRENLRPKHEKHEKFISLNNPMPDYKQGGIFKALFHAGVNACQIDGDPVWGYTYLGAEAGVGAMARFHRVLSLSLELNYSMEGARATYGSTIQNKYLVQWDYVQAPVALNAHYKQLLIVSAGLTPGYMVRYKELSDIGANVTSDPPLGQPRRFDLAAFAALHFVIKRNYAIGLKYSYSTIKIRGAYSGTHVNGEYNNYLTLRFMYILDTVRKKRAVGN